MTTNFFFASFQDNFQRLIRFLLDSIAFVYAWFFYPDRKNELPPIKNKILLRSAIELADDIRTGQLTSEQVVQVYLDRIKEVNKLTNSIVHINPLALEEARKIDQLIRNTKDKRKLEKLSLIGVPFTAKDSVCIQGMKVTVGLVSRSEELATHDTDVVIQLRNEGAVPIAITNTPELLLWWDAHNNSVGGRTKNPFDLSRIPGGSTGGCASLVASAGSVLSVASDIGGSTRIPANFCGVYGHKTSSEVISSKGKYPEIESCKTHLFSFGPICRYAKDLRPCIAAMAGREMIAKKMPKLFDRPSLSDVRVFYMEEDGDPFKTPVSDEIRQAIRDVCSHLEQKYQAKPVQLHLHKFRHALTMWRAVLEKLSTTPFTVAMSDFKGEISLPLEILKSLFNKSDHTRASLMYALSKKLSNFNEAKVEYFINMLEEVKKEFYSLLGEDAVFLYPCHPEVAPKQGTTLLKAHNCGYTAIFNILSVPVTQCPIRLSQNSMPIGIQIATSQFNDHLSLTVAEEIEKAFGGWRAPCEIHL